MVDSRIDPEVTEILYGKLLPPVRNWFVYLYHTDGSRETCRFGIYKTSARWFHEDMVKLMREKKLRPSISSVILSHS